MSESQVALVTGANRGIGLETARQLAQAGVHVLVGARSEDKGRAAVEALAEEGLSAAFILIDMEDPATFRSASEQIDRDHGRLDILVNNAAIMHEGDHAATSEVPIEAWRQTLNVNVLAQIELTHVLLPLIRKSAAGRIVNLSSILGSISYHSTPGSPVYDSKIPAYDVSKSALNAWTVHLAYELRETPIKVNAVHPGWVKTEMGGEQAPMEIVDGARSSVMMALLPSDGPTATYTHMGKPLPW
jgi:NAD(P)-dependent dehydrogenase (short-subunit alcohol dehydrogenase family)